MGVDGLTSQEIRSMVIGIFLNDNTQRLTHIDNNPIFFHLICQTILEERPSQESKKTGKKHVNCTKRGSKEVQEMQIVSLQSDGQPGVSTLRER